MSLNWLTDSRMGKPMPDLSEFVTTSEAAKRLGFHMNSIQHMVKNKTLEGVLLGHTWLISKASIEKYLEDSQGLSKNDPRRGKKG